MKKYSGEVSIFADEMSGSIMEIEFEDKNMQKSSKKVQVIRKSARCVDRANIVKLNQKVKATPHKDHFLIMDSSSAISILILYTCLSICS